MAYCSSCGSPIPDDQGSSCSMCYGDINHGHDGYYQQWAEQREMEEQIQRELEEAHEQEIRMVEMDKLEKENHPA